MKALRRFFARLSGLLRNSRVEEELDREIAAHLVFLEEEFARQGMPPAEAKRAARHAYGGVEQAKQLHRDERSLLWLDVVFRNFRYASRQMKKSPGFSVTVVLTLALGIATSTAIFSLVDGILLRPLPFSHPDRLVLLGDRLAKSLDVGVTAREIGEYSRISSAFSSMGGFTSGRYELSGEGTPEVVHGARLTAGVFRTLGVQPILGRVFTQQEEDAHQTPAVISYAFWSERFQRNPRAVGTSIELNRRIYTIVGVMPRGFDFPLQTGRLDQAQIWTPLSLTPQQLSEEGNWSYQLIARLKDGVTIPQAAQDAGRVAHEIMREFPPSLSAIHISGDVIPLHEYAVRDARPLLHMLLLAAFTVLLIACLNAAALLLVKAIRRRREYALRLALGARTGTIVGESLAEGLLFSLTGGLLGLILAALAMGSALRMLPDSMPSVDPVSMNGSVVAFALFLAVAAGVLCSCAPAYAAAKTSLLENLKEGFSIQGGGRSHAKLRSLLVIAEVGITVVLLILSGAFLRSYQKMLSVDPGFQPEHVLVAEYQLPAREYPTNPSIDNFNREAVDRLSNKSGVAAVGISTVVPDAGGSPASGYTIEGVPAAQWRLQFANFASIYGDYFRALGIPLIEGRYFTVDDRSDAPLVVIVNQSMARHCWPGQSAIGQHLHAGNPRRPYPWATVVGVVADTKPGARDQPGAEQWYIPMEQPEILGGAADPATLTEPGSAYITLRAALPPEQMVHTLRSAVASIDPLLALDQVRTMEDALSTVEAPRRFNTVLITAFALGSLLLALTGIYAVVALTVSLRSHEIAVRMALGARRSGIVRLVLAYGLKLALLGCMIGVAGGVAGGILFAHLMPGFLFDVSATDPLVYAISVVFMLLIATLASALPAQRAASTDPMQTLRSI